MSCGDGLSSRLLDILYLLYNYSVLLLRRLSRSIPIILIPYHTDSSTLAQVETASRYTFLLDTNVVRVDYRQSHAFLHHSESGTMELKLEIQDTYDRYNIGGSSCPSTSGSVSSCSTRYGPYTPNSGRSTPTQLDGSFCVPLDISPPSSVASGYYQHSPLKSEMDQQHYFHHTAVPAASGRYNSVIHGSFSSQDSLESYDAQPGMDMYTYSQSIASSPLVFAAPTQSAAYRAPMELSDLWSIRTEAQSPISLFEEHAPTLKSMTPASDYGSAKARMTMPVEVSRPRKSKSGIISRSNGISVVEAGDHFCKVPGCDRTRGFKRSEHLKRHEKR